MVQGTGLTLREEVALGRQGRAGQQGWRSGRDQGGIRRKREDPGGREQRAGGTQGREGLEEQQGRLGS